MEAKEVQVITQNALSISNASIKELKDQREMLTRFVQTQLREADFSREAKEKGTYGEGDYGVIPGTPKRCLFKQGAEKLLRLFGLGVRVRLSDKEFDLAKNFALYTYRAEVFVVKSGITIAECEGTANSQEKKYKEKKEWVNNKSITVPVPVPDIINTLQKMAQKRAIVGATMLAVGASEYFTQDVLDAEDIIDVEPETPRATVQAKAPQGVSYAEATGETQPGQPPLHCGQPMILSKYVDKEFGHKPWYCLKCKHKEAAEL